MIPTPPADPRELGLETSAEGRKWAGENGLPASDEHCPVHASEDREGLAQRLEIIRRYLGGHGYADDIAEAIAAIRQPVAAEVAELKAVRTLLIKALATAIGCSEDDAEMLAAPLTKALAFRRLSPHATGEWLPIESAPKDGTRVMVWRPRVIYEGSTYMGHVAADRWVDSSWWESRRIQQPTHWMPLPPAPPSPKDAGQ